MGSYFTAVIAAVLLNALIVPAAATQKWSRVGTLNCTAGPSIGLLMGSLQKARCVFRSTATGKAENYSGRMEREGLELGITPGTKMLWAVLATTARLPAKSLTGRYAGAAEESVLAGERVEHALCNAGKRSVCLQAVGDEANGNLAPGISAVKLE
jgi:hypothetical protein